MNRVVSDLGSRRRFKFDSEHRTITLSPSVEKVVRDLACCGQRGGGRRAPFIVEFEGSTFCWGGDSSEVFETRGKERVLPWVRYFQVEWGRIQVCKDLIFPLLTSYLFSYSFAQASDVTGKGEHTHLSVPSITTAGTTPIHFSNPSRHITSMFSRSAQFPSPRP